MKILHFDCSKDKIPSNIYQWCRKNNFHSARAADGRDTIGLMYDAVAWCIGEERGHIYVLEVNGNRVAWALVSRTYDLNSRSSWEFQCYVLVRQRRKGYGTMLLKHATEDLGTVSVLPHDDKSRKFYESNGKTKKDNVSGKKINKL